MIARLWRGWTSRANADAYEQFLRDEMFPSIIIIDGCCGTQLLRRDDGDDVAFITICYFDNLESVRRFAGDDYEKAVVHAPARKLLARFDARSEHFDVAIEAR